MALPQSRPRATFGAVAAKKKSAGPELPLAEVRRALASPHIDRAWVDTLRSDPRPSVAALIRGAERRWARQDAERQRRDSMLELERTLFVDGRRLVAGVDEAGLGPLAGPIVAAAVILGDGALMIDGIDDSKKLDARRREILAAQIYEKATAVAIGMALVGEIDDMNVYHAGLLAMRRAVEALPIAPDHVLVDARRIPDIGIEQSAYVKGDARSLSIAAASIVAKVHRDALMRELDRDWPGYGFAQHKGYGTPEHQDAIRRLGASPVHRRSYEAVQELVRQGRGEVAGGSGGDAGGSAAR